MRRPDSYASLQPTHSTTVSIINPSYRCLPAASKATALPRSHLPHQPNPHSAVRGILRAPSPAGSFLGEFRTPATGVCRADVASRHPKPSTGAEIRVRLDKVALSTESRNMQTLSTTAPCEIRGSLGPEHGACGLVSRTSSECRRFRLDLRQAIMPLALAGSDIGQGRMSAGW